MRKLCIFILVAFYSISFRAQTYKDWVRKADSCYRAENYRMSVDNYEKAFKIEQKAKVTLYNAGCSASMAKENKKAFKWLNLAIDNGYENITEMQMDRDLKSLHTEKEWQSTIDHLQKNLDVLEANYDKPLQKELLAIYADDQEIRKDFMDVYKNPKKEKKQVDSIGKIMIYKDSLNLIKVSKILDERGWVGKSVIGAQANQTLFLVIQHSPLKTQQKYLPMMRDAVKKGDAKASSLALLEDRVALREGRKQIYGSQSSTNRTTGKSHISPMIDPDNVDKRRAEVGLGTIADYAVKLGIVWNLEAYKKELPELEKLENIR